MAAIIQTTFSNAFSWMNVWISIEISLKLVPKGPINNIPSLVQIMAWRRPGDKPLSEPMMVRFTTQICVTRPQWVKNGLAPSEQNNTQSITASKLGRKAPSFYTIWYGEIMSPWMGSRGKFQLWANDFVKRVPASNRRPQDLRGTFLLLVAILSGFWNESPLGWLDLVLSYRYGEHENMSPCMGSKVNANYERNASWDGHQLGSVGPES